MQRKRVQYSLGSLVNRGHESRATYDVQCELKQNTAPRPPDAFDELDEAVGSHFHSVKQATHKHAKTEQGHPPTTQHSSKKPKRPFFFVQYNEEPSGTQSRQAWSRAPVATKPRNAKDAIPQPVARKDVHQPAARRVESNGGPTSETRTAPKRGPF